MSSTAVISSTTPPSESVNQFPEKGRIDETTKNNNNNNTISSNTQSIDSSATSSPAVEYDSNGPTPPPSGIASKSVPKAPIEKMFETFHQSPSGDFKPTFYNPFEVKHRRRTSKGQFKVLERVFMDNPKPTAEVRQALAMELNMTTRSIQVWFQNRRAKLKTQVRGGKLPAANSCTESESSEGETEYVEENDLDSRATFTGKRSFSSTSAASEVPAPAKYIPIPGPDLLPSGAAYPNQQQQRSRSNSLPDLQKSPQLPFRQLQEALFGGSVNANRLNTNESVAMPIPSLPAVPALQQMPSMMSSIAAASYFRYPFVSAAPQSTAATCINPQQTFHVDPNRLRPRSSSFTIPRNHQYHHQSQPQQSMGGLTSIAEQGHHHLYQESSFLGNEESSLSAQMSGVDLDYYMALGQSAMNYNPLDFSSSATQSPIEHNYLLDPAEMAFLPQPSNEILLSTLIDDKHFE